MRAGVEPDREVWLARLRCLRAQGAIGGHVREILAQIASSGAGHLDDDADVLR